METNTSQSTPDVFENVSTTTAAAPYSVETFQICIIVLVAFGLLGNATVFFMFATNKEARKRTPNILIMNQLTLDACSCGLLITSHSIQLASGYLSGTWGVINCYLFVSDMIPFITLMGSIASLVIITFERYVKIVHPLAHRNYFRSWMIGVGILITWINGVLCNIAIFWTTEIVDGNCESFAFWPNDLIQDAYGAFALVWQYLLPIALFTYFYGHIFVVIRKSSRVFPRTNGLQNNPSNNIVNSRQRNIIKTLVMVTVVFAVCWGPNQAYYMMLVLFQYNSGNTFYWWTVILAFLNVCVNPFVYAYKHKAIRKQLNGWLRIGPSSTRIGQAPTPLTSVTRLQLQ